MANSTVSLDFIQDDDVRAVAEMLAALYDRITDLSIRVEAIRMCLKECGIKKEDIDAQVVAIRAQWEAELIQLKTADDVIRRLASDGRISRRPM